MSNMAKFTIEIAFRKSLQTWVSRCTYLSIGMENQYSAFNRRRLYESLGLQACWCPFSSWPIRKHRYFGRSSTCRAGRATSSALQPVTEHQITPRKTILLIFCFVSCVQQAVSSLVLLCFLTCYPVPALICLRLPVDLSTVHNLFLPSYYATTPSFSYPE